MIQNYLKYIFEKPRVNTATAQLVMFLVIKFSYKMIDFNKVYNSSLFV